MPDGFAQLKIVKPRFWWPYQMGEPYLCTPKFRVETGRRVSDHAEVTFGIREVTSGLTDKDYRLFKINGKRVLIRGAAWAPDLLLRWSEKKLDADLAHVKHMGLNTIRLEGKMERSEFFDKTDRLGILVMPGWTTTTFRCFHAKKKQSRHGTPPQAPAANPRSWKSTDITSRR